jgi:hypothetical protein
LTGQVKRSDRRSFVHKLLGLVAVGGASTLLTGGQIPRAAGNPGGEISGSGTSGQVAYWTNPSQLAGFPSILNPVDGSIALGTSNTASASGATVAGGASNTAGGGYGTVGGGYFNAVSGSYATVGGGDSNKAGGDHATVAGGGSNTASGSDSTIGGGGANTAGAYAATVGGGTLNTASGMYTTIAGGQSNTAGGDHATIGGGQLNTAGALFSTIGGGLNNMASVVYTTVGGGTNNAASGLGAFVGGGGFDGITASGNIAVGAASTIGGGLGNTVSGSYAVVGGGYLNKAGGSNATIAGGVQNMAAGGYSTVGGGFNSTAGGYFATVPGGQNNSAAAFGSFAVGSYAKIDGAHNGAMLFSDGTYALSGVAFNSVAAHEFAVRATGGFRFVTGIDTSGGVISLVSINSSGSIGVRTTAPTYPLDLQTSGLSSSQMHITPTGVDSGGYLTSANPGNLFMSAGAAWNGSAWVAKNSTAYQYGGGSAGVRFFFDTGLTVGGTYTPTTRMFIGPTGHVGIGMSTAPGHLLQLGLDDAAKPSTNTWTISSDGRLKDPESIEPFTEGSEFIKRLPQPVWFRYRKDSGLPSDRTVVGWVAQDVAPVAPFMVRRTKQKLRETDLEETETLSLNTNELPYALVNSTKEMLEWREEIVARLREKDREIAELKTEMKARFEKVENRFATPT